MPFEMTYSGETNGSYPAVQVAVLTRAFFNTSKVGTSFYLSFQTSTNTKLFKIEFALRVGSRPRPAISRVKQGDTLTAHNGLQIRYDRSLNSAISRVAGHRQVARRLLFLPKEVTTQWKALRMSTLI